MLSNVDNPCATAAQGAETLSQEGERQHNACNCPPKSNFVFYYQQSGNDDCDCGNSKNQSPSKSRQNTNNSLRLIESFVDLIKSDSTIEYALRKATNCNNSCGPKVSFGVKEKLFSHVGAAASPLMREEYVWEGGGIMSHRDIASLELSFNPECIRWPWIVTDLKKWSSIKGRRQLFCDYCIARIPGTDQLRRMNVLVDILEEVMWEHLEGGIDEPYGTPSGNNWVRIASHEIYLDTEGNVLAERTFEFAQLQDENGNVLVDESKGEKFEISPSGRSEELSQLLQFTKAYTEPKNHHMVPSPNYYAKMRKENAITLGEWMYWEVLKELATKIPLMGKAIDYIFKISEWISKGKSIYEYDPSDLDKQLENSRWISYDRKYEVFRRYGDGGFWQMPDGELLDDHELQSPCWLKLRFSPEP